MNFRRALVAATILAMPIAAYAQPVTGIYLGAGAGVDIPLNQDVKNLTHQQRRAGWPVDFGPDEVRHGLRRRTQPWVTASATASARNSRVFT